MADSNGSNPTAASPPRECWRLSLLGAPKLERIQGEARLRLSRKDGALLALIAVDGAIAPERVASLLWPAASARTAEANLRQRLFRLRRDTDAQLVETGAQLRLAAGVQTDWMDELARVAEDPAAARAEFLGDSAFDELPEFAAWVRVVRARWHQERHDALAAAASRCEASGALARALVYALRLAEEQPFSEHAQRRVMRLHYMRGDATAAIAGFERFERQLKEELGARPSAETIELLTTIERGAAALPVRRVIVPASLMRPPRMIGRSAETAALARAWAEARGFVLLGEAGLGKSRLLQEFGAVPTGAVVANARPGDANVAYAVAARLLREILERFAPTLDATRRRELGLLLPELGSPPAVAGVAQRLLLQSAVERTLGDAATRGLTGIILDDAHLADGASVAMLQSLMQSPTLTSVRWGFAQRPVDGDAVDALRLMAEETQRAEVVVLQPLDVLQITELVESLGLGLDAQCLAPALLKHTGGNPMFVLETLKDVVLTDERCTRDRLPQPTTVATLVERRLAQLTPAALKLARTAAIAGESFCAELACHVLEVHPLDIAEPWRELESAQVIRQGAFAHDLIYEAARASVPAAIAELLHRRIAVYLVAQHAEPGRIASHWAGGRQWALAGEAFVQAALRAQSASQRIHEVEHWQQARACFDQANDFDRSFDARCESVPALIVVQGVARAHDLIDVLVAEARTDRQRVRALTARAMAALMAADHESGIAAAIQAGAIARQLDSPWPLFEAARLHAVGLAQSGRATEGLAVIGAFREQVERDGDREHKGHFWSDYAYVLNTARHLRETAYALERAIEYTRELGDLTELATLTSNLATVKGNLGSAGEALDLARRALAIHVQLGETSGPAGGVVETYVGLYCGMAGRYAEALERLDSAIARFLADGQLTWIAVANNHKASLLLHLGQFARAEQALRYSEPPVEWLRARRLALLARVERALGRSGESLLRSALKILEGGGDRHLLMQALLDEAERLDPASSLSKCEHVLRMAEAMQFGGVAARARLTRALALHRGGSSGDAAADLRLLLPTLEGVPPADVYLADAWWIAKQVFEASGSREEAAMAQAQGVRWIHHVALPNVPEVFQDSFLRRNATNRALLVAARHEMH